MAYDIISSINCDILICCAYISVNDVEDHTCFKKEHKKKYRPLCGEELDEDTSAVELIKISKYCL